MLEATMHRKGVLESRQMGGAFAMLRAQDLLWQPMINQYLKGQRGPMIDLMAWNADGTRMPWRMHSEYLYRLYLDNELATNRFPLAGKLIRLSDISVPMFVVGTEADHVAPWKSVYKVDNLVRSDDLTFLLTPAATTRASCAALSIRGATTASGRGGSPTRTWRRRTGWRPRRNTTAPGGRRGSDGSWRIPAARARCPRWALRARAIASSKAHRDNTCGSARTALGARRPRHGTDTGAVPRHLRSARPSGSVAGHRLRPRAGRRRSGSPHSFS